MSNKSFKLLIVEDEKEISHAIECVFKRYISDIEITIVSCRDEAFSILEDADNFFDYITLDLNIPSTEHSYEKTSKNGMAVLGKCVSHAKGTPVLVITGTSTADMISEFLRSSEKVDVWGNKKEKPSIDHLRKEDLDKLSQIVDEVKSDFEGIFHVELSTDGFTIPVEHDRLLRIFSKKKNGAIAKIKPIGGGLSEAKVYSLDLYDCNDHLIFRAIAKCGPNHKIKRDAENYDEYISRLEPSATPRKIELLTFGAASYSAVFYGLAAGYNHSFFKACEEGIMNDSLNESVKGLLHPWHHLSTKKMLKIQDVRRFLLSDDDARHVINEFGLVEANNFETKVIPCSLSMQHGDLHGENILIDVEKKISTLIDYGDVLEMVGIIDSITLECSFLFHPNAKKYAWPSDEQLEKWFFIDDYVDGCPVENSIRFCRGWTDLLKRGNREVSACLYSYALRQLKYNSTNKNTALRLIHVAYRIYDAS